MTGVVTQCPAWEYHTLPDVQPLLAERGTALLIRLRSDSPSAALQRAKDTRPIHNYCFRNLTPPQFGYYAGHYRGEDYLCLRHYEVQIISDPRVGYRPEIVPQKMASLATDIEQAVEECDIVWRVPNATFSQAEKLYRVIRAAVAIFVYFLEIHPYANGNGHMARFVLIAMLARYGIFLRRWRIDPRPQDPPYSNLISLYRSGFHEPLERFVLQCI